jgi:hypothetical protein
LSFVVCITIKSNLTSNHFDNGVGNLRNLEMHELNFLSDEKVEEMLIRVPKRYFRDYQNPFEFYSEWEFRRRFRFSKNSVMFGILFLVIVQKTLLTSDFYKSGLNRCVFT